MTSRRSILRAVLGAALAYPAAILSGRDDAPSSNRGTRQAPVKSIAVLDAPSNLGLRPPREDHEPGVWRLPQSLRAQGIVKKLAARDVGSVARLRYSPDADLDTGFRNGPRLVEFTIQLADRIGAVLDDGCFPLVLGGDCSILLGSALALRRRGRHGLCFIDGHNDFSYARDPKWRGLYTAAGLDLALATGHGPDALTNIENRKPYFLEEDVAALGVYHDRADEEFFDVESFYRSKIGIFEANRIRKEGAEPVAQRALEQVARGKLAGFWIHLDADVLNKTIMPAVDSPNAGGITFAELAAVLRVLLSSHRALGMHVTILDPELDPRGKHASEFVALLVDVFQTRNST